MKPELFTLPSPEPQSMALARAWLLLAVGALVLAGLFTLLIVLSRTPFFQAFIPWLDFFHTALVVHVDLTVLVWFLSFAGVLWSFNSDNRCMICARLSFYLAVAGTLIITVSPFTGEGRPLMNNYVPVLQNTVFFTGLCLFGLGFSLLIIRSFIAYRPFGSLISNNGALRFGLYAALVTSLIAVLAFILSWLGIDQTPGGEQYYDQLFWGSGHIIQFTHTLLMLVVWLWLAGITGAGLRLPARIAMLLFVVGMAPALFAPYIYFSYDVDSTQHLKMFFNLMKYGGGLAAFPVGLAVILGLIENRRATLGTEAERNALVFSILLFGVGGVLGFMIIGSNVTIPAHYHGSIVGVTLAYMGITYHLLPVLGFRKISWRIVRWQPGIYGIGQLMHIMGLAWSGGYGVSRKTAGDAQGLEQFEQVAGMALMGLGGLISIIGAFIFILVVFAAIKPQK